MGAQRAYLGILVKLVPGNVIDWENQLDVVLFRLLYEPCNLFGASRVKQGVSDLRKVNCG